MTRILAIETSTESCSVALNDGDAVRERFELAPLRHAELILPFVRELLAEAGWAVGDLDVIAFGRGPGSFTSLRIGIGVVQGLAWGAELPVVPVSSLQAVAQAALEAGGAAPSNADIRVAMDARMDEVFHAVFRADARGIAMPHAAEGVCAPEVLEPPARPYIAAGNGFARYPALQEMARSAAVSYPDLWPHAASVLALARRWLEDNDPLPAAQAQPVYIRNTVAQKPRAD